MWYTVSIKSKEGNTMKNEITGITAWEMVQRATRKYTKHVLVKNDPWWGEAYDDVQYVMVDGKTYERAKDRDGWDVLIEIEG